MKKITLYVNSITRQRLSRSFLNFIEYNSDVIDLKSRASVGYELLEVIKAGQGKIEESLDLNSLCDIIYDSYDVSNEMKLLAASVRYPTSRKCWSMKPENFERWARKSSILAIT